MTISTIEATRTIVEMALISGVTPRLIEAKMYIGSVVFEPRRTPPQASE